MVHASVHPSCKHNLLKLSLSSSHRSSSYRAPLVLSPSQLLRKSLVFKLSPTLDILTPLYATPVPPSDTRRLTFRHLDLVELRYRLRFLRLCFSLLLSLDFPWWNKEWVPERVQVCSRITTLAKSKLTLRSGTNRIIVRLVRISIETALVTMVAASIKLYLIFSRVSSNVQTPK